MFINCITLQIVEEEVLGKVGNNICIVCPEIDTFYFNECKNFFERYESYSISEDFHTADWIIVICSPNISKDILGKLYNYFFSQKEYSPLFCWVPDEEKTLSDFTDQRGIELITSYKTVFHALDDIRGEIEQRSKPHTCNTDNKKNISRWLIRESYLYSLNIKKYIRILVILILTLLTLSSILFKEIFLKSYFNNNNMPLGVSDYIYFGYYESNPIVWEIKEIDDNNLATLTLAGSDVNDNKALNDFIDSINIGNNWEQSYVRKWLNNFGVTETYEVSGEVELSGFLSKDNFSKDHINRLESTQHMVNGVQLGDYVYFDDDNVTVKIKVNITDYTLSHGNGSSYLPYRVW